MAKKKPELTEDELNVAHEEALTDNAAFDAAKASEPVTKTAAQVREDLSAEAREHLLLADGVLKHVEELREFDKPLAGTDRYTKVRQKLAETIGALR